MSEPAKCHNCELDSTVHLELVAGTVVVPLCSLHLSHVLNAMSRTVESTINNGVHMTNQLRRDIATVQVPDSAIHPED